MTISYLDPVRDPRYGFYRNPEKFMAIRVDISISLRSEYGVTLGRLLKVSDKQLLVAAESKFRPGAKIEFQLELPAYGTTVYGLAQVTRITIYTDAPNRYLLVITQLSTKDRQVYQEWLYDLAQVGGGPSRSSALVSSIVSTLGERPSSSGSRRVSPPKDSARPTHSGSSPGRDGRWSMSVGSAVSDARTGVGRAAVREALRARFAERLRSKQRAATAEPRGTNDETPTPPEPTDAATPGRYGLDSGSLTSAAGPALPPKRSRPVRSADAEAEFSSKIRTVRPTRTAGGGDITVTHSPEAERQFSSRRPTPAATDTSITPSTAPSQAPKLQRVQVTLALDARPPVVTLRYNDASRFCSDWTDYLSKDAIFVRWRESKPGHRAKVTLRLVLPSEAELSCDGEVVALMPSGFGLSLKLDDEHKTMLESEARAGG